MLFVVWLRRVTMILVPIMLVIVEWDHPAGFSKDVYNGLAHMADMWWFTHIYQAVLFGAAAVGALLLTYGHDSFFAWISRISIWVFAVCYTVFDSTAGIAVGEILKTSLNNAAIDVNTVKEIVQKLYTDPITGGTGSLFSLSGSWAWLLGLVSAVIVIYSNNSYLPKWKLLPPLFLLLISGYSLYVGHYAPYGPIAFSTFTAAALWFEAFRFGPAA